MIDDVDDSTPVQPSERKAFLRTVEERQRALRDSERETARELFDSQRPVRYCAGRGHPVVVCRDLSEFDAARSVSGKN